MITLSRPDWPYTTLDFEAAKPVAAKDHKILQEFLQVIRGLDRIDFLIETPGVANNVWFEFSPAVDSIVFELKAHAKAAGVGTLTAELAINGTVLDSITLAGGSTAVSSKHPAEQIKVYPTDKLSLNLTAVNGAWGFLTFTVILEPRIVR